MILNSKNDLAEIVSEQVTEVKVFTPATVANVAVGFDILGFALDKPGDEIIARFVNEPGLRIVKITGDGGKLPYNIENNTAGFAAQKLLEYLNEDRGIELEIHKKMPFGTGMGSSAASAVGGAVAVNELLGCPLSRMELLPFAVLGEQVADGAYHADNVAPCLLGGITLIRSNQDLDVHSLPLPKDLYATIVFPAIEILTKDARGVLKENVPLKQMIEQTGNLGGLIVGLMNADYELIGRSLNDVVIEPQRAHLIPHFYEVKKAALKAGALGCSISGAGPSIFALSKGHATAEIVGNAMQAIFNQVGIANQLYVSPINPNGAIRI
ncbi:MAG: homoserine kinase [Saprospiraceae bacterium]|nr:homoserine kinase [Saprospiraceae bacterium]